MKSSIKILPSGIAALLAVAAFQAWADPGIPPTASTAPAATTPSADAVLAALQASKNAAPAPATAKPGITAAPAAAPANPPVPAPPAAIASASAYAVGMAAAMQTPPPAATAFTQRKPRRTRPVSEVGQDDIDKAAILWQRSGQAAGVIGTNGVVMYAYGESRPTIRCAPLHLCVIQLMHGEDITDISIGDSVRWKFGASRAGDMPVIIIKPVTVGLETNLNVLTDAGRVYYMTLRSSLQGAVPLVQFFSPEDIVAKVNKRNGQLRAQAQTAQETRDATLGKIDPATLDFGYACTGKAKFKPTEVFSGNGHIYLKMPEDMKYRDSPAVFDTSGDATQLINSRYARGYQVLDGLPEKFKLVVGVGSGGETVECTHGSNKDSSDDSNSRGRYGNVPYPYGN